MRRKLESQADRIEAVLVSHNVDARVTGGTVTPSWVRYQVLPGAGSELSQIAGLSQEFATALGASDCRVFQNGADVAVKVERDDAEPVRLLPLYGQLVGGIQGPDSEAPACRLSPATAVLGLTEDGAPLLIRLPSPDVRHILVSGTGGSGKTGLFRTMILSLAMANPVRSLVLMLVDSKGHTFGPLEGLPHLVRPIIRGVEEKMEALQSLTRLVGRRSEIRNSLPRVVVVIDELADLLQEGGRRAYGALTRLTQRGCETGIHIIAAMQQPTTTLPGMLVRAHFAVRLVGRGSRVADSCTATAKGGTGGEGWMVGGEFLALAKGRGTRFHVAHVSPAEIREVVARLVQEQPVCAGLPVASPLLQLSQHPTMSQGAGVV